MTKIPLAGCLELLTTGKYSDLVIDCQGTEFNVHRAVVCQQSSMLDTACSGPFKEAGIRRIKFPEQPPDIMARAILFMYTAGYSSHTSPNFYAKTSEDEGNVEDTGLGSQKEIDGLGFRNPLKVNTLLYACPDMLDIVQLEQLAADRFMRDAEVAFDLDGFEGPLQLLYEDTRPDDRDLRFRVTCLCVQQHDLLEIRTKTVEVLQEHEGNAWGVSVKLLKAWMVSPPVPLRDKIARGEISKAINKFNKEGRDILSCRGLYQSLPRHDIRLGIDESGALRSWCATCPD